MLIQFGIHYAVYVASAFIAPSPPPAPVLPPPVVLASPIATEAVHAAVAEAETVGYTPCHPVVLENIDPEVYGWAMWPELYGDGVCEVGIDGDLDPDYMQEIARHEVCHLATGPDIWANPPHESIVDPSHDDPTFTACFDILSRKPVLTLLERAQEAVGASRTSYGFTPFWCSEFVEHILSDPRYDTSLDSPSQLKMLVPSTDTPQPGDLVFVSFQPANGETHHVAFIESVNDDGSVNTIEGNYDPEFVVRHIRFPFEITGYGRP